MQQFLPTMAFTCMGLLASSDRLTAQDDEPGPHVVLERPETFSGMTSFAIGPKQKWVAGGSAVFTLGSSKTGGDVLVWDLPKRKLAHKLTGHGTPVSAVAFAGKQLVSFSAQDANLRTWDLATGKQLRSIDAAAFGQRWEATNPVLADDGSLLLRVTREVVQVGNTNKPIAGTLEAWDVDKGELRWKREKTHASTLAISPDGKRVAYYAQEPRWKLVDGEVVWSQPNRLVRVLDATGGSEVAVIEPKMVPVSGIAIAPNNRSVVIASMTSLARYSLTSKKQVGKQADYESKMPVQRMQFSSDGKHVAVFRQFGEKIEIWEVGRTPKCRTIAVSTSVIAPVAFTSDLAKIACEREGDPALVELVVDDKKKRRRR